jgi:hypothetical protein
MGRAGILVRMLVTTHIGALGCVLRSAGFLVLALIAACFASCSTLYEVGYGMTLEGHAKGDALAVEKDDLHFRFYPTPAGVAFALENKGDEDAVLDWTQSYFVAPDGTSSKPLQTETLVMGGNASSAPVDRVIVPRDSVYRKFTALSSRAGEKPGIGALRIRSLISERTTKWQQDGGWTWSATEPSGFAEDLMPNTLNRFDFPLHYPLSFRGSGGDALSQAQAILDQVKAEPRMVLALSIEVDGERTLHRFEFVVEGVFVTTLNYSKDGDKTIGTRVLAMQARAQDNWELVDTRAASGVQERKGMEQK